MIIALAIVIVIVFLIGGPLAIYYNQTFPELRSSVVLSKDLFIGCFSVIGILIAAENLRRSAVSARTAVALKIAERWNDLSAKWQIWHTLHKNLIGKSGPDVVLAIQNAHEETVAEILNFLEEIASSVNAKSADERQIWKSLGPTMLEYYGTLTPWIQHYRELHTRPHAWAETESLMTRWKRSPPN